MKTALLRMLISLKFWTVIVGAIVTASSAALAKYGLDLSDETVKEIATWLATGFTVLLGGQALTDHGKAKAEIETRSIQSGFFRLDLLVIVFAGGSLTLVACSWLKSETKHVAADVVDCTKAEAVELAKEFGPTLDQVLASYLSDNGKIDRASLKALAKSYATDSGRCVLARAVARLLVPRGTDTQASPLPIDAGDVAAAWDEVRRAELGGKTFALGAGA